MSELNGLANILGNAGTLHTYEPPPQRADQTDEEYEHEYRAWQARMTFWSARETA